MTPPNAIKTVNGTKEPAHVTSATHLDRLEFTQVIIKCEILMMTRYPFTPPQTLMQFGLTLLAPVLAEQFVVGLPLSTLPQWEVIERQLPTNK